MRDEYARLLTGDHIHAARKLQKIVVEENGILECCPQARGVLRFDTFGLASDRGLKVFLPRPTSGAKCSCCSMSLVMDTVDKASRRVRRLFDSELTDLVKWASSQTPHENEFTMSAWVPKHLRGLMKFVNDLRQGEGRISQNSRRMQEEICKIDRAITNGLTPYDRKKHIAKVTYMRILGVDAPIGYQEGLRLMASESIWDKQVGYLYISLVFDNKPEMQRLVVQCVLNDLSQSVFAAPYVHQLALGLVSHFQNVEIIHHVSQHVDRFLCSTDNISGNQQSAAVCQEVVATVDPDMVSNGRWLQNVMSWLETGSVDAVKNVCSLLRTLLQTKPEEFSVCIPQLLVFLQESVKKLQKDSPSGSRVSPAAFVDLLACFENAKLTYDEEFLLVDCVKKLLLHFATAKEAPRFKAVTDGLEAGFTERPMFGVSYEWLKRAPSFRQETVVFPALRLIFRRGNSLELMREGLDYYARYLRDRRTIVRRAAIDQVIQVARTDRGFALLKSRDRWSVAILMQRVKDEPCEDIRDDICRLCFLLITVEDESNLLCQGVLEHLKAHLNGLSVRRLLEEFVKLHERALVTFQKFVYMVIELTDHASNQVSATAQQAALLGIVNGGIPQETAASMCVLLEEKLSRNSSDAMIQLSVVAIGALHRRYSGLAHQTQMDSIIHLLCDLAGRTTLNALSKAYLVLQLAVFGAQIQALPLRSKIIDAIKLGLDKPKASREFQAYQSFMLIDDAYVPSEIQLQALRFVSASVDKATVSSAPTVRPRPRPSTIHESLSQHSDVSPAKPKADDELSRNVSTFDGFSHGPWNVSVAPSGITEYGSDLGGRSPTGARSFSPIEGNVVHTIPWTDGRSNIPWVDVMPPNPPAVSARKPSTASSVEEAVRSGRTITEASPQEAGTKPVDALLDVSLDLPFDLLVPSVLTPDDPLVPIIPVRVAAEGTPSRSTAPLCDFDPFHSPLNSYARADDQEVNLLDMDAVLAAKPHNAPPKPSIFSPPFNKIHADNSSATPSILPRPLRLPGSAQAVPADSLSPRRKQAPAPSPKAGWTFTNPWHSFDLGSVVQSLNLTGKFAQPGSEAKSSDQPR